MKTIKESIIGRKGLYSPLYILYPCGDDYYWAIDRIPDKNKFTTPSDCVLYCMDKLELDKYLKILRQYKKLGSNSHRVLEHDSALYRVVDGTTRTQIVNLLRNIDPIGDLPYDKLKELTRIA